MLRTLVGLTAQVATGPAGGRAAAAGRPRTPDHRAGGDTGQLHESIRVPAAALGPLQGATERLGRLVDRLPDRKRRGQALPG